jgi:hypothetical protein
MLPECIKIRIELKFGSAVRYPKDCQALSASILTIVDEKISPTTLMRLFGIVKNGPSKPRLFTLDLIAQYIGFKTWHEALNEGEFPYNSCLGQIDQVFIPSLNIGTQILVKYSQDCCLHMEYLGENEFKITNSEKSKLIYNDIIRILRLDLTFPIVCENVTRNGIKMGKFISRIDEVITHLSIIA